jgi:adenine-specific DNA-methyltransferase
MARKKNKAKEVDSLRHRAKRKNIPTEELHGFVKEEDEESLPVVLCPRDPSLDPQLVWKGKDEQNAQDFEVPAVPIYLQEKIKPQAITDGRR